MSQLGQAAPRVEAIGGSIAAVAVTATFSQMAFAKHLDVPFPLLSDWGRETCGAYGVRYDIWKEHDGLAKRSLFVIDREGVIRYRWMTEDALVTPDEREAIDVMASL
ncbi:MAG TPA: redoxin domain-containing protein [Actinomycetota bacterium]|nr:redoxin domain-containing protein [Actinomycetota bacterium]